LGRQQAAALAERLASCSPAISHLYTSPVLRARQTAEPIARQLGSAPIVHDGLRELNFGQVSGLTLETFRQTMPRIYAQWQDRSDLEFQFPGGEQRQAFFRRVGLALDEVMARYPRSAVAVVAHGGTLRAGLAHLFPGTMRDWWAYALHNGSLTRVRTGDRGNRLVALDDCQHLPGTG
jgi:probable phosphoglycerate mutase